MAPQVTAVTAEGSIEASSERIQFLLGHGFTEYQARAYVALLGYESCTVGELSRASSLPRNRLYEVLEDLQAMGLAQVQPETPRRYRARPLAEYLRRRAEALRSEAGTIESRLEDVEDLFVPPPEEANDLAVGATRILQGRRAVAREVDRFFLEAREELGVVSSTRGLDRVIRYVQHGRQARAPEKGLQVFLVVPAAVTGTSSLTTAEQLFAGGITIVDADFRLTMFLRDREELLLVQAIPESSRLRVGDDFALLTTNPAIVHDHLAFLDLVGHHTTHPS